MSQTASYGAACSNQGSIKRALEGKASEKARGRADNIMAEVGKLGMDCSRAATHAEQ